MHGQQQSCKQQVLVTESIVVVSFVHLTPLVAEASAFKLLMVPIIIHPDHQVSESKATFYGVGMNVMMTGAQADDHLTTAVLQTHTGPSMKFTTSSRGKGTGWYSPAKNFWTMYAIHNIIKGEGDRVVLTCQELLDHRPAVLQCQGEDTDSGADGVPASNPVPEAKGIIGVDAELCDELEVGADGHHVLGHSVVSKL